MMDEQLRQRLVGAMVLVALGVIFIPMLLDGGPRQGALDEVIPQQPERIRKAFAISPTKDPAAGEASPEARATEPDPEASKYVILDTAPQARPAPTRVEATPERVGKADNDERLTPWDVQVASLSKPAYATELRDKLRAKDYPTFIESITSGAQPIYRVRIGPVLDKAKAQRIRDAVEREFELKGLVTQHHYVEGQ